MYSVPCEAIFNDHPAVARSALVGVGRQGASQPVIVVEPEGRFPTTRDAARLSAELLERASKHELTNTIRRVLFHRRFPVDVRHNAKINRESLAQWAMEQVK